MSEIVQSLWIGKKLPAMQQLSIRSFVAQGHPYHLYAYEEIEGVPAGVTLCEAEAILPRKDIFCYQNGFGQGSCAAFSNVFRYKLINEKGGWWVDTDVVCLRPFDFQEPYVFAMEYKEDFSAWAASCVFKSPPGAHYLSYCLDVCRSVDKASLSWGEIGPELLDRAVKRFGLIDCFVPPEVFNPINWFEVEQLVSPDFDLSRLANSYAVHLWNHMWPHVDLDADDQGSPLSLYGQLKERYLRAGRQEGAS